MNTDLFFSTSATLSPCEAYRYRLGRSWDADLEPLVWVMLNPSTADASRDDPTIRRVVDFTRAAGYGGCEVVNLYALRATDPKKLWTHPDPVGPNNDLHIEEVCRGRDVVAAWGAMAKPDRALAVTHLVRQVAKSLRCLGLTMGGAPKHPLYVPAKAEWLPYGRTT